MAAITDVLQAYDCTRELAHEVKSHPRRSSVARDEIDQRAPETARNVLPVGAMPRGLSRVQAAEYVGVSPATFDRMIRDGLMPAPIRIYGRVVWDIRKLDEAFAALDKSEPSDNPWQNISL